MKKWETEQSLVTRALVFPHFSRPSIRPEKCQRTCEWRGRRCGLCHPVELTQSTQPMLVIQSCPPRSAGCGTISLSHDLLSSIRVDNTFEYHRLIIFQLLNEWSLFQRDDFILLFAILSTPVQTITSVPKEKAPCKCFYCSPGQNF